MCCAYISIYIYTHVCPHMYIHELWCHQNQLTELVAATDHLLLHQVTAILINDRVCLPLSVGFASWLLLWSR